MTLSRSGDAFAGEGVRGDVRAHDLGLAGPTAELRGSVTHVVVRLRLGRLGRAARGWRSSSTSRARAPRCASRRGCPRLEKFVHLSSVLVLGRRGEASTPIVDELELGQSFRSLVRVRQVPGRARGAGRTTLPWRAVRVGRRGRRERRTCRRARKHGIMAVVPPLLRGYPMHLKDHGRFPCYPTDVMAAGEVLARAALDDGLRRRVDVLRPRQPVAGRGASPACAARGASCRGSSIMPVAQPARAAARRTARPAARDRSSTPSPGPRSPSRS